MLKESQRLNAAVWKAKKQGVSYGTFCTALTEEKYKQKICKKKNGAL